MDKQMASGGMMAGSGEGTTEVDEHPAPRQVLLLPDRAPGWALVRQALAAMPEPFAVTSATAAAVLAGDTAIPERLDMVLTGVALPGTVAALEQLRRRFPAPVIGVIVPRLEPAWYLASGEFGALAYLLWQDVPAAQWPDVLRLLLAGATVMFSRSARDLLERWERDTARAIARPPASPLTVRELQVAQLLIGGLSHAEIARRLRWSQRTVERTVSNLRAKYGAPNDICLGARLTGNGCPCPALVRHAARA